MQRSCRPATQRWCVQQPARSVPPSGPRTHHRRSPEVAVWRRGTRGPCSDPPPNPTHWPESGDDEFGLLQHAGVSLLQNMGCRDRVCGHANSMCLISFFPRAKFGQILRMLRTRNAISRKHATRFSLHSWAAAAFAYQRKLSFIVNAKGFQRIKSDVGHAQTNALTRVQAPPAATTTTTRSAVLLSIPSI